MDTKKIVLLILSFLISIAALILTSRTITWDGGFPQAEYRIRFIDEQGKAVPGVTLEVRDKDGKTSYCYPVTDFAIGSAPVSDPDGIMLFHHIELWAEFGGRCTRWLGLFSTGKCDPPSYTCIFSLAGEEVARFDYGQTLAADGGRSFAGLPTVTRSWKKDASCGPDLPDHLSLSFRDVSTTQVFPIITKEMTISVKARR